MLKNAYLEELLDKAETLAGQAAAKFGGLSAAQLNWKPAPERWSIGQCFAHLMVSNKSYFSILEKVAGGEKRNTWWENMPFLPGFFGRLLLRSLHPDSQRKVKTVAVFRPSQSLIPGSIIRDFVNHQNQLIERILRTDWFDHERVKITSPASQLITYSLRDCCLILITHEERHIRQAERVQGLAEFPAR